MLKRTTALVAMAFTVASGSLFAEISKEDKETLEAFGYSQAQQFKAYLKDVSGQMGISEEEIAVIVEGMRKELSGEKIALDVSNDETMKRVEALFTGKRDKAMAEEAKRIAKLAEENKASSKTFFETLDKKAGVKKTESGLRYEIKEAGEKTLPKDSDYVTINYVGKLADGTEFDRSPEGQPASFPLNGVIPGFSEGLKLIGKGGKITLYIPSDLGYGEQGAGRTIPPSATLVFDVELLDIKDAPPPQILDKQEEIEFIDMESE